MSWLSELLGGERRKAVQRGLAQLQRQQGLANAANETRYQDILGQFNELETTGLEGLGQAAGRRIGERYAIEQSRALQSLVDRGLGNTTVLDAARRGLLADEARQYQDLDEQLRRERMNLSLAKLGFMERRTDQGIDPATMFQLSSQLGAAQAQPSLLSMLGQGLLGGASILGGTLLGRRY